MRLCDTLPRGLVVVSAPRGRFTGGRVCWSIGPVANGTAVRRTLLTVVEPDAPGRIANTATATGADVRTVRARGTVRTVRPAVTRRPDGGVTG